MIPSLQTLWHRMTGVTRQPMLLLRPLPKAEGTDPLPALGQPAFVPLAAGYTAPQLFCHNSEHWLLALDPEGRPALLPLQNDSGSWLFPVLGEEPHADPLMIDWCGDTWLLARTEETLWQLYRCVEFPALWQAAGTFAAPCLLAAPLAVSALPGALTLEFSEPAPEKQTGMRPHRFILTPAQEGEAPFIWQEDEAFALTHRGFSVVCRAAGACFALNGSTVTPRAAEDGYVQFYADTHPLCAATIHNLQLPAGLTPAGVTGYARSDRHECLAIEIFTK